eukprot:TRINITY_DN969_c0_g1_i2.p1 TRINITY_DN969_c0_g1~~TRINITY_DN969_c0_g1_i2.p1  ORF type:complete len:314 (-),score=62.49 TRINITY_DN969_c0_g1_i2:41-982(-)
MTGKCTLCVVLSAIVHSREFFSYPCAMDAERTIYPRLKGKVVLITGASAGIGLACANHFAACGSNLILIARRTELLEQIKKTLEEQYKVSVFTYSLDVRSKEGWDNLLTVLPEELKNVDVLVNNAGLALSYDLTEQASWVSKWLKGRRGNERKSTKTDFKKEDVNTVLDVNVKGLWLAIHTIVPIMKARKTGHIINVGSIAGKEGYAKGSIYCASKFAVEGISDALRKELVDTPIRVTKICPGFVETEFSVVRLKGDIDAAKNVYNGLVPLTGDDIADNIVYCASRPANVQIADMIMFPVSQASAGVVHRNTQ